MAKSDKDVLDAELMKKTQVPATKTDAVIVGSPYAQLLTDAKTLTKQFLGRALEFYWHLGKRVEELTSTPDKYGNKSLEKFSEDLSRVEHIQLGVDSLYDAQKLAKCLTKNQLDKAKDASLSVRRALPMCVKNVTSEMRDAILEEAKSHTGPDLFKVEEAVAAKLGEATGGSGKSSKDKEGSDEDLLKKAIKKAKGAEKMIALIENKLRDLGAAFKHICTESDEEAIVNARTHFEECSNALDSFGDTMRKQMDIAAKALEKVKDVKSKKKD